MRSLMAFVCISLIGVASADECECGKAGRVHLVIARRAITVGDYQRAIAEYQASYEADGQPLTLIFLARAYTRFGELRSAIETYREYLEEVPFDRRTYDVESEIARLSEIIFRQRIASFDDDTALLRGDLINPFGN